MEKCCEEIKLRVPESLLLALSKLANMEDRSLSEYCRTVLSSHAVIAEAADRLMAFQEVVTALLVEVNHPAPLRDDCPVCRLVARYRYLMFPKDRW